MLYTKCVTYSFWNVSKNIIHNLNEKICIWIETKAIIVLLNMGTSSSTNHCILSTFKQLEEFWPLSQTVSLCIRSTFLQLTLSTCFSHHFIVPKFPCSSFRVWRRQHADTDGVSQKVRAPERLAVRPSLHLCSGSVSPESLCGVPWCSAESLAQKLVLEFRRSWLPSLEPRRGRQSLRSSLQEVRIRQKMHFSKWWFFVTL